MTDKDEDIGWYNPDYTIGHGFTGIAVQTRGRKKLYHGGFDRDLWSLDVQEKFPHREKTFIVSKNIYHLEGNLAMSQIHKNMIADLQGQLTKIDSEIAQLSQQVNEHMMRRMRIEGSIEGLETALRELERAASAQSQSVIDESLIATTPETVKHLEHIKNQKREEIATQPEAVLDTMGQFKEQQKNVGNSSKLEFMRV